MNGPLSVHSDNGGHSQGRERLTAAQQIREEGISMNRSSIAKGVAAAVAGAMALSAVGVAAQAQPYPAPAPYGGGYAACQQQAHSNGLLGAIIGGGIGAVLGSNVASNHHRSDGGLVGGGVGALVGASVGSSSANCNRPGYAVAPPPQAYAPPPVAYAGPPAPAYYGPPPPPPAFAYGYRGERFRIAREVGPDGCTLAESPVYLPDGRVERRFVRACMGPDGLFHVVG
ncbi:MAG: glycine zipper 2TM domain-containing protein [Phenylobacterium sp.]|nr:MAG: glycine zipper 2TM domain-containing protein [Phenylobacterium sp.]